MTVRPSAPSGNPQQAEPPPDLPAGTGAEAVVHADACAIRYQRVFQLTPQTLVPYAGLTYPSLAPGSARLAALTGELLGVSAMAGGTMVGLAIAERVASGQPVAQLRSLMVEPARRRQGIATRMLFHLQRFLTEQGVQEVEVRYKAGPETTATFEPLLQRLGWTPPETQFVLLQSSAQRLAAIDWHERYRLQAAYELFPWMEATRADMASARASGAAVVLLPPPTAAGLEPSISLGLRHRGALVGWLIAHRVDATTVRYSSLYVAPRHRRRGQGLALLAEGFQRQQGAGIPRAKAAIQVGNNEFMRVFQRHLWRYLLSVGEARASRRAGWGRLTAAIDETSAGISN